MSEFSTYPLRLPLSIWAGVERVSKREGVSMDQFLSTAVAEKIAMLEAQTYFEERRARADLEAFDRLMARQTGESPRAGDILEPS